MKKLIFSLMVLFILISIPYNNAVNACTIPTITILGVTEDTSVTVETQNFPAQKEFEVRMGLIGTKGINGIIIGTVDSGSGGGLAFTFVIPDALRDEELIAIRLDSTTGGYYSYNWFTNATFGTHESNLPIGEVEVLPIINIVSVKKDSLAIVKGSSFPVDEDIDVLMGEYGTEGVDGEVVGTINADSDGIFIKTFTIPDSLHSEDKIAIRFELVNSDIAVYNWFENRTGASGGTSSWGTGSGYSEIPTFTISGVVEDNTVTITTNNFPANIDFKVLMGKMWTQGINGIDVTTINSGDGGSFSKTFEIPAALTGEDRIAIRLQAVSGGYYAYNWFYNNTYP